MSGSQPLDQSPIDRPRTGSYPWRTQLTKNGGTRPLKTKARKSARVNRRSRGVKQTILLIIAGLVVAGCCSTENEMQHLSTSDLQLRRYELMYCLSMTRMSWDKRPWQSNAHNDAKDELKKGSRRARKGSHRARNYTPWRDRLSLATFGDIPIRT
jgi:hypothetical protein